MAVQPGRYRLGADHDGGRLAGGSLTLNGQTRPLPEPAGNPGASS